MPPEKSGPAIDVRRYSEIEQGVWDDFVGQSLNGTIFHRRHFLNYHPAGRFEDCSVMFFNKNRLIGVFPAALVEVDGATVLKSHPGASYGGLVVKSSPGIARASGMVESLLQFARQVGCARVELRIAPKIFSRYPTDEIDFALRINGFDVRDVELSTCYPLARLTEAGDKAILKTFADRARWSVNMAMRSNVDVRLCEKDAEFGAYWDLLAENLKKHRATPTHSKAELIDLRHRFPDDILLLAAFHEREMIAGVLPFIANAQTMHIFYIGSRSEHQAKQPLGLVIFRLIEFARRRGLRYVNFGISTEDHGRHVNWSLFKFKEGFGGHGIIRSYWVREL